MEPILRTEHLTFTYPGEEHPSLGDLSLEIARGSFVAILGHNGSGKSTLAKLFNAILLPTGGKVCVDGMDTADENNLLSVRATVGMVFQNPDNQIVANVVEDDVAFAPENLGVPPQEIRTRVDAALSRSACMTSACTRRTCSPADKSSAWPSRASSPCSPSASCLTSRRPCSTRPDGAR